MHVNDTFNEHGTHTEESKDETRKYQQKKTINFSHNFNIDSEKYIQTYTSFLSATCRVSHRRTSGYDKIKQDQELFF